MDHSHVFKTTIALLGCKADACMFQWPVASASVSISTGPSEMQQPRAPAP
jgi:hypothetical protein